MVATKLGIVMARSVRRIPLKGRSTIDSLEWVRHAQWHMYKDSEDADGDIPEGVRAKEREEKKEIIEKWKDSEGKTVYVDERERANTEGVLHIEEKCRKIQSIHERVSRVQ